MTTAPLTNNNTQPEDSLNTTVSSVVDGIVETAVSTASIQAEKTKVQALINKFVSQVHDNAVTSSNDQSFRGVPLGDHRQRKCYKLPVTWTQTMDSITLNVDVPPWVRKQQVSITFTAKSINAAVNSDSASEQTTLFDELLVAEIAVDGCMWALEEEGNYRKLIIEIEKARIQWWATLFMSDDPVRYKIVNPTNSPLSTDASISSASRSKSTEAPSVRSAGPLVGPANESTSKQGAESHLDSSEPSDSKLEDSVAGFVDDIIQAAASGNHEASIQRPKAASAAGASERPTLRQQRVLTRADIPKMVEQCKKVIANGEAGASESALQLATFYHHGLGVGQDDAEAARLYRYALENGILDPSAAFQLGLIYNQGAPGLEPNATEAVRWWRVSASLRNPVAMFNLGVMYMNGSGCEMDPIMATRWFQQAQALDARLQPPQFSRAQLEEKITTAMKLRKQRLKRALPPEEKQRRKEEALRKVRVLVYGSAAIVGLGVSVIALRYWWRNRL